MTRFTFSNSVAIRMVVLTALAVACGCTSKPDAKSTVDSMTAFGEETSKAKDSVNSAVKALETLSASQASEITANLDAYSKSVDALDGQAKLVKATADKMKANGDSFFKDWEGSSNVSPDRRAELTASYAKIKDDMVTAKDGFTPFLASLKDVQSYLSLDPTLKGINSMSGLVQKAKDNGASVNSQLDVVLTDMNAVRGMLSTK